jgi:hypothetical protein
MHSALLGLPPRKSSRRLPVSILNEFPRTTAFPPRGITRLDMAVEPHSDLDTRDALPEVRQLTKSSDCMNKPYLHGLKRIVVRVRAIGGIRELVMRSALLITNHYSREADFPVPIGINECIGDYAPAEQGRRGSGDSSCPKAPFWGMFGQRAGTPLECASGGLEAYEAATLCSFGTGNVGRSGSVCSNCAFVELLGWS